MERRPEPIAGTFPIPDAYKEAMVVIEPIAEAFWEAYKARRIELEEKDPGTISEFEEFVYVVAYDIAEQKIASAGASVYWVRPM